MYKDFKINKELQDYINCINEYPDLKLLSKEGEKRLLLILERSREHFLYNISLNPNIY